MRLFRNARDPRTVFRVAKTTAWLCLPAAVVVLILWLADVLPGDQWTSVAYYTLMVVGMGSAIVAALAACQLAIHHAFRAGFETGQASVWPGDPETRPGGEDSVLRLVQK